MTRVQDQRKFAMINCKSEGQGVYYGKLLMTEDKGHMFVIFTVLAVVHMIYVYYDALVGVHACIYTLEFL